MRGDKWANDPASTLHIEIDIAGWVDEKGDTCEIYCRCGPSTADDVAVWAVDGISGADACCKCGCVAATCDKFASCLHVTINKGSGVSCVGDMDTCDTATCCDARATCDSFSLCAHVNLNKGGDVSCAGDASTCDTATCCDIAASCASFSNCIHPSLNKGLRGANCVGDVSTCDASSCCDTVATCHTFACHHESLNQGVAKQCIGAKSTCDTKTCCDLEATCDVFTSCSKIEHFENGTSYLVYQDSDPSLNKGFAKQCIGDNNTCDDATCCNRPPAAGSVRVVFMLDIDYHSIIASRTRYNAFATELRNGTATACGISADRIGINSVMNGSVVASFMARSVMVSFDILYKYGKVSPADVLRNLYMAPTVGSFLVIAGSITATGAVSNAKPLSSTDSENGSGEEPGIGFWTVGVPAIVVITLCACCVGWRMLPATTRHSIRVLYFKLIWSIGGWREEEHGAAIGLGPPGAVKHH